MTPEELVDRIAKGRLAFRVSEAASAVGYQKSKFYDLIKKGEIRTISIGGQMRVPVTELLRLISPPDASTDEPK
jgi:excisionase family DNA binding protein